jgi:5-methylcytosine-specific restriction enzyme A
LRRAARARRPAYHGWYHLVRWHHPVWGLRTKALRRSPFCVECRRDDRHEAAVDVDHVVPHRGDPRLFWSLDNLAGLCRRHHARKSARGE